MSTPVVKIHVSHEVFEGQWCDDCLTSSATTIVVWVTSESGVQREAFTGCERCEDAKWQL